jgi:hypothetical protein
LRPFRFLIFSDQLIDDIREYKKLISVDYSNRAAVIENLKFLHDCCVATEDLLWDAGMKAGGGDLGQYYMKHLYEERGEIAILRKDLWSIDLKEWEPNPIAIAMIGTQYYMLKHIDPVSLLGYMAVQEADPTPIETVEQLERLHGKGLFHFLRLHAIKDQEHRKELIQVIDNVSEENQRFIVNSAQSTLEYLAKGMEQIYGRR